MNQADRIRNFAAVNFIYPARKAKRETTSFTSGEIHRAFARKDHYPSVCEAIDTDLFAQENRVELIARTPPQSGATVRWTFKV